MSRSRKKNPVVSDYSRNYTKFAKRQASRKVRYYKGYIPDGSHYKKLYCSWNIFDYKWFVYENEEPYICSNGVIHLIGSNREDVKRAYRK